MRSGASLVPEGKGILLDPANIFLALGLLIGVLYCAFIPYGAGFDEERHIVRIFDISGGYLMPNRNPPTFRATVTYREFAGLSYQRRITQSPALDMFSRETFGLRFGRREEDLVYRYVTGSIYSPVIFFPQALVARLFWRKFDFPILPVVILMRVAGLMVYIVGGWLAVRLLPLGKWVFVVLALSPMALFQATTLNADGFTNAVSFLFIASTLHVYANESATIQPRWVWALIGCSLLLGLAKPGAIVLLPLLLILPKERFASAKWIVILGLGAAFAVFINAGWIIVAMQNSKFGAGGAESLSLQFGLVLANLGDFIVTYLQGIFYSFFAYIKDWTAAYGYWAGNVPKPVYLFYMLLLLAVILAEPPSNKFTIRARIFMVGVFLLSSAAILTLYFIAYYTPGDSGALGRHGRYFIPFAPLLFIALSGLITIHKKWNWAIRFAAIGSFLIVIGFYSFGIYTAYYTYCGYQAYVGDECVLPIYKNLEKEGAREIAVTAETPVSQTFTSHCNSLEAAQVFVTSVPSDSADAGTVRFSLLDENSQVIASEDIPVSEIPPLEYLTLPVASPVGSRDSNFEIRLEVLGSTSPEGIGAGVTEWSYHDGILSVAGEKRPGDLIFHYTCARP